MLPLIVATRIHVPPLRSRWLHRSRLTEVLNENVYDHALTLISAPAGFGKTTLASQWAHEQAPHTVAWVTLEPGENDPENFLRYLVAAWDDAQPGTLASPVGLLAGSASPDLEYVLQQFVNGADASQDNLVFVLDDLHMIDSDEVLQALGYLIEHAPASTHFVATCRGLPSLPLARMRARGTLFELSAAELAFDQSETRWMLGGGIENQNDDLIADIHRRFEGWPAGLQLAGQAMRRAAPLPHSISTDATQRFHVDYLRQEVIDGLPRHQRQFLLQTSILEQLSGSLCDEVLGQYGSQQELELLEEHGLFLQALDDTGTWFRYHPIFAGVLRDLLQREMPTLVPELHRKAARWFLAQGMPIEAFEHAVNCEDIETLTRIIGDYVVIKLESGELHTVANWVERIPASWYERYPSLSLLRVPYLIYSGSFEEGARQLSALEQLLQTAKGGGLRDLSGKIATARCAIACFLNDLPLAETYASAALRDLSPDDRFYRASVFHALGETYARNAHWEEASTLLKRALSIRHEPSYLIRSVHIYGALADLDLRQGRLHDAEDNWLKAMEAIQSKESWGRLPIPVTGWVSVRLAELKFERNRVAEAEELLERGLELALLGGEPRSLLAGYVLAARIRLSQHEVDWASEYLDRAGAIIEQAQFAEWNARYERMRMELWIAQGRFREVAVWSDDPQRESVDPLRTEPEIAQLTLARAFIVLGDYTHLHHAWALLQRLGESAATEGRLAIQVEASALAAIALDKLGDTTGALIALERALRLASPQGYIRLFADPGPPIWSLLQKARSRGVMPKYVDQILAACADADAGDRRSSVSLIEPLSTREREVLGLIAAGLTNAEIAEKLFVSPETVKKHSSSIYAKMAVRRRTEAVARARDLGLLKGAS